MFCVVTLLVVVSGSLLCLPPPAAAKSSNQIVTEEELKSSLLWQNGGLKLILVKRGEWMVDWCSVLECLPNLCQVVMLYQPAISSF